MQMQLQSLRTQILPEIVKEEFEISRSGTTKKCCYHQVTERNNMTHLLGRILSKFSCYVRSHPI